MPPRKKKAVVSAELIEQFADELAQIEPDNLVRETPETVVGSTEPAPRRGRKPKQIKVEAAPELEDAAPTPVVTTVNRADDVALAVQQAISSVLPTALEPLMKPPKGRGRPQKIEPERMVAAVSNAVTTAVTTAVAQVIRDVRPTGSTDEYPVLEPVSLAQSLVDPVTEVVSETVSAPTTVKRGRGRPKKGESPVQSLLVEAPPIPTTRNKKADIQPVVVAIEQPVAEPAKPRRSKEQRKAVSVPVQEEASQSEVVVGEAIADAPSIAIPEAAEEAVKAPSKRGRRKKTVEAAAPVEVTAEAPVSEAPVVEDVAPVKAEAPVVKAPAKKRGRPKKAAAAEAAEPQAVVVEAEVPVAETPVEEPAKPKRGRKPKAESKAAAEAKPSKRGRKPKAEVAAEPATAEVELTVGAAEPVEDAVKQPVKRKRGRPKKVAAEPTAEVEQTPTAVVGEALATPEVEEQPAPARKRGRKKAAPAEETVAEAPAAEVEAVAQPVVEQPAPRKRGRPKKVQVEEAVAAVEEQPSEEATPKRKRGRPKKSE